MLTQCEGHPHHRGQRPHFRNPARMFSLPLCFATGVCWPLSGSQGWHFSVSQPRSINSLSLPHLATGPDTLCTERTIDGWYQCCLSLCVNTGLDLYCTYCTFNTLAFLWWNTVGTSDGWHASNWVYWAVTQPELKLSLPLSTGLNFLAQWKQTEPHWLCLTDSHSMRYLLECGWVFWLVFCFSNRLFSLESTYSTLHL